MKINDPSSHRDARPFGGYEIDRSDTVLTLWWDIGSGGMHRLFTAEEEDAVYVLGLDNESIPHPDYHDGWALMGDPTGQLVAKLAKPLGRRAVIDAATGEPLTKATPPYAEL